LVLLWASPCKESNLNKEEVIEKMKGNRLVAILMALFVFVAFSGISMAQKAEKKAPAEKAVEKAPAEKAVEKAPAEKAAKGERVTGKVAKIEGNKVTVTTKEGEKTFEVTGKITAKEGDEVSVTVVDGKAKSLAKAKVAKAAKKK